MKEYIPKSYRQAVEEYQQLVDIIYSNDRIANMVWALSMLATYQSQIIAYHKGNSTKYLMATRTGNISLKKAQSAYKDSPEYEWFNAWADDKKAVLSVLKFCKRFEALK